MTAAEILRSAQPPSDDVVVEKAIAELDVKIWEWTDALKSAQAQLRSAFAVRPVPRTAAGPLFDDSIAGSLSAAAAAAHIPSPAPMPKQWTTPPAASEMPAWNPAASGPLPALSGQTAPFQQSAEQQPTENWPQRPQQHGGHGVSGHQPEAPDSGSMQWPSPSSSTMAWPDSSQGSSGGAQAWPTWSPNDASSGGSSAKRGSAVRATKAPKAVRQPLPQGPSPEERAQKAAAEEALLSGLEDAIARRVRLLRRLDPDTQIEKLIEKARQGHAEAPAAAAPRDDKSGPASSWWRRK